MKLLCTLLIAAMLDASAADFAAVHATMTWTQPHTLTNQVGQIRSARTAPASPTSWASWRTNKPAMKLAGYSARPTPAGWQAIQYVKP